MQIALPDDRKAELLVIVADLEDGHRRYSDGDYPGAKLDAKIEQLYAAIGYIELTLDGSTSILQPLRELLEELMDLHSGCRPEGLSPPPAGRDGRPPIGVRETRLRGRAIALMQLYCDAGETEELAAKEAAKPFRGVTWQQIKSWRKRRQRDPAVNMTFTTSYRAWKARHPDEPRKAAEVMKTRILARPAKERTFGGLSQ